MKNVRQAAMLNIIRSKAIATQTELAEELRKRGISVTQATISRDIKELGLIKVADEGGTYRYVRPQRLGASDVLRRAQRAFIDYVIDVDYAGNLIVVKTLPGTAQAVAAALDDLAWPEIVGTIGGDDAILVIVRQEEAAPLDGSVKEVLARLGELRK
ncbi:MAG: arginine repressor [Limnochordia bacterium]|jgi:transcriptional regulator of arginine metabolism|nr:arginine repressor [Bacillota bacterium]